jgi:hypothetical protein
MTKGEWIVKLLKNLGLDEIDAPTICRPKEPIINKTPFDATTKIPFK